MSRQYVFLPDSDLGGVGSGSDPIALLAAPAEPMASGLGAMRGSPRRTKSPGKIIERLGETGACLVEVADDADALTKVARGGTFHPVVYYSPAVAAARVGRTQRLGTAWPMGQAPFVLRVVRSDGKPVANATVGLMVPPGLGRPRERHEAATDSQGVVRFAIRAEAITAENLLVIPGFDAHWGLLQRNVQLQSGQTLTVDELDMTAQPDALRSLLKPGSATDGAGVVVGIVDTGVGPHPDLPQATGDDDTTLGHGTHVAGIVAGRGQGGFAGVAPGATIRSYRVFDDPASGVAANHRIYQAILRAAAAGCHLINLSLKINPSVPGNPETEPVVRAAVQEAARRGALVFAAAGNDWRKPVAFPARMSDCVAVSAIGSHAAMPAEAYDRWTESPDRATTSPDLFFANFSNQGAEVDLTAPGAGIVSTVPGGGYAPMSGTSMACPAAVGMAARLIAKDPSILSMPPSKARHDAMLQLVKTNARRIGLGPDREGWGMLG